MEEKCAKRDYLAQDRTHLANERTLLAHQRTALTFFVLGAFLLKFFPQKYLVVAAAISIICGAGIIIYGIVNFFKYKKKIDDRLN